MRQINRKLKNKNYTVDSLIPDDDLVTGSPDEHLTRMGNKMVWYPDKYHENKITQEIEDLFNDIKN